jgi:[acyl-carrier-protein] S-malonyltransferase
VTVAFVFPGQGAQKAGFGTAWVEADPTFFAEASAATGVDVAHLVRDASDDELRRTDRAQLATAACSLAGWRTLRRAGVDADLVAGHSVGELSALVAAGAMGLRAGLRLVGARGRAMATAAAAHPGTMAALVGVDRNDAEAACAGAGGLATVANLNAPDQVVVAGTSDAVAAATAAVRRPGVRVVPLAVGGAFHSPLMAGAVAPFARAVVEAGIADAALPVVCNVDGRPHTRAAVLVPLLVAQLCSPVEWVASVRTLAATGVDTVVEVGSGVLTRLLRRQLPGVRLLSVAPPADVDAAVTALRDPQRPAAVASG